MRDGIRKVFQSEDLAIGAFVGSYFPEARWEVAVFGARNGFAARAVVQLCFELPGGPSADFVDVLSFERFVMAIEGVLADAVVKGDWRWRGGRFIEH